MEEEIWSVADDDGSEVERRVVSLTVAVEAAVSVAVAVVVEVSEVKEVC